MTVYFFPLPIPPFQPRHFAEPSSHVVLVSMFLQPPSSAPGVHQRRQSVGQRRLPVRGIAVPFPAEQETEKSPPARSPVCPPHRSTGPSLSQGHGSLLCQHRCSAATAKNVSVFAEKRKQDAISFFVEGARCAFLLQAVVQLNTSFLRPSTPFLCRCIPSNHQDISSVKSWVPRAAATQVHRKAHHHAGGKAAAVWVPPTRPPHHAGPSPLTKPQHPPSPARRQRYRQAATCCLGQRTAIRSRHPRRRRIPTGQMPTQRPSSARLGRLTGCPARRSANRNSSAPLRWIVATAAAWLPPTASRRAPVPSVACGAHRHHPAWSQAARRRCGSPPLGVRTTPPRRSSAPVRTALDDEAKIVATRNDDA